MHDTLLNAFAEYLEKQDMLSKLTEHKKLHEYGYSEIHTIAAIGDLANANVTSISNHLHMTRSAISKITKRLLQTGMIETYRLPDNRQKIFFSLTENGRFLYEEHRKRHQLWLERDDAFFSQFSNEELSIITQFMQEFNNYLGDRIQEWREKDDEKD